MALAASDFTNFSKFSIGDKWLFIVQYTGPASYAAPESLTKTIAKQALQGISEIKSMIAGPAYNGSGGQVRVQFEPTDTSTEAGKIRFSNDMEAHTHNLLIKGGLTIADAAGTSTAGAAFGKASATDETVTSSGTAGGVVATTASVASTEVAGSTNLSTYSCWFIGIGVE